MTHSSHPGTSPAIRPGGTGCLSGQAVNPDTAGANPAATDKALASSCLEAPAIDVVSVAGAARKVRGAIKGKSPHRGKQVTTAQFRRMWYDADLTVDDIAKALNVCRRSVWQRARHRGMPDRTTIIAPGPKPTLDAAAEAMWRACVRGEDIAAAYGVNVSTVHMHVHRKGIKRARQVDRWHPAITLADYRAAQLREAMAATAKAEQAAARDYWRAA